MTDSPIRHVLLIHGIWMRGLTMLPLARRLRSAGYAVEIFDYPSVTGHWGDSALHLVRAWRHTAGAGVHVVGHSLGGMLAVHVASTCHELPDGRIVCLGSPLRGSSAAHRAEGIPGGRWLMGQSAGVLHEGLAPWTGQRQIGVIAGSRPFGLGAMIGALERPHDGTVSVEETRLPGIQDHCVVASTHTGLLFSAEVASKTINFLRSGRFGPEPGLAG